MKKLKVAIFGIGFMGRVHTEALRRLGNVEVAGVAGRTAEAARKFADGLGIERATGNYQDLLADPELNAVHICTPNELHFPMAQAAMRAGKHVLCEKPLASTIAEANAMIALAKEKRPRAIAPSTTCALTPRCRTCVACAKRANWANVQ